MPSVAVEMASLRAAVGQLREVQGVVDGWQHRLRGGAGGSVVRGEPALAGALGSALDGWARTAGAYGLVVGELARLVTQAADAYEAVDGQGVPARDVDGPGYVSGLWSGSSR